MSRQAAPRAAAARPSPVAAAAAVASRPLAQAQHEEIYPSEESYEAEHEHEEEHAEEEDELHTAEGQQSRDELEDEEEHAHHYQLAPIQPQVQAQSQSQPQRSPPHRVPKPSSMQVQSESQWHATPSNARKHPASTLASPDADLLSGVRTVPSTPPLGAAASGAVASVGAGGVLVRPPKRLLDAGLAAVKTNLKPGLALQCVALLIIIVYFGSDSARAGFDQLAAFKSRAGYAFSAVSTSIFGGLLPWLIVQAKKESEFGWTCELAGAGVGASWRAPRRAGARVWRRAG